MSTVNIPPASVIAAGFGPMVTGIMIQQLLFGVICSQITQYWRQYYEHDSRFDKSIVISLTVLNVFIACLDFHVLYRTAVIHYGNYDAFDLQDWTMWLEPGVTAVIGAVAQVYFLNRCWKYAQSRVILAILILLALFALGGGLSVSVSFFIVKRFSELALIPTQITLWLVSTSVCDVAITGVLIAYLRQTQTPVKRTEAIIIRLIRTSMETSALTAICATLNFVFYKVLADTAYHLLPQFSMSRVYTMTVLYTLLGRRELRDMFQGSAGTMQTGLGFASGSNGSSTLGSTGIRVTVQETSHSHTPLEFTHQEGTQLDDIKRGDIENPPSVHSY